MPSHNSVTLIGHLTRDPELRYIPSGTAVADFGLAVNEREKKGDQWVDVATFVDITAWAKTAEIVNQYLVKGSATCVVGRLKLDTWEKDGQKRSKLKVIAEKVVLLGNWSEPKTNSDGYQAAPSDDVSQDNDQIDF